MGQCENPVFAQVTDKVKEALYRIACQIRDHPDDEVLCDRGKELMTQMKPKLGL
jgi:hypothetical protein